MYLRWQTRKRQSRAFGRKTGPDVHWAAIIVESKRVGGKPTQRHVAYLGGITESAIAVLHQRCWFWEGIVRRLDGLGKRMSSADRRRIEAVVAQKVPRPTKKEYERCARDIKAYGIDRAPTRNPGS
jgi:hypothetical protein